MITHIISDFSRVLFFPKNREYTGKLNQLYDEEYLKKDFVFFNVFEINISLVEGIKRIAPTKIKGIFTSGHVQNAPELTKFIKSFQKIISAETIPYKKDSSESYKYILELLGAKGENVIYIDDLKQNIDLAARTGMRTIHYQNNNQCLSEIQKILDS